MLPDLPANVTVPYLPLVNCWEEWVEGYPYQMQDALCGLEDGIREVHMCRDPVQCSRIAPDYHDTMLQHHTWHLNQDVRGLEVALPTPPAADCTDFKSDHSTFITADQATWAMGDTVCDEGRLWECKRPELCHMAPYASWLDRLAAWAVLASDATVTSTAPTFTADKPALTDNFCTDQSREFPVGSAAPFAFATGLNWASGATCATASDFYKSYLWSTRVNSDYFDLDFVNT